MGERQLGLPRRRTLERLADLTPGQQMAETVEVVKVTRVITRPITTQVVPAKPWGLWRALTVLVPLWTSLSLLSAVSSPEVDDAEQSRELRVLIRFLGCCSTCTTPFRPRAHHPTPRMGSHLSSTKLRR